MFSNPYPEPQPFASPQTARKKKAPPLHVSLRRIEAERVNRAKRTENRFDILLGNAKNMYYEDEDAVEINARQNYSLIITCFCVFVGYYESPIFPVAVV
jgi:hypothetical protein